MGLFETRAAAGGVRFRPATPSFDLRTVRSDVAAALSRQIPALDDIQRVLGSAIPVPTDFILGHDQPFYRLANHNRSFCYSTGQETQLYGAPTVVFKGAEPLLSSYGDLLSWMEIAPLRQSSRVMLDHFPFAEGKIPGALSLGEAMREAALAAHLQQEHLRSYGELARIPTPLFVHRIPDEAIQPCRERLRQFLAESAFERIQPQLEAGLAVYSYCYPCAPLRANAFSSSTGPKLGDFLATHCPPERAISGWLELLARLFHLGFLPTTPRSEGLGACMDFGNATMDGGFCDLDSIEPMRSSPDDEFFFESMARAVDILASTIGRLIDPDAGLDGGQLYPGHGPLALTLFVVRGLEAALTAEARPGLTLDPRVRRLLGVQSPDQLRPLLQRLSRPTNFAHFLKQKRSRA